jgi:hypothetical protein
VDPHAVKCCRRTTTEWCEAMKRWLNPINIQIMILVIAVIYGITRA